jgi:Tfp pilus assembly protein PilN
MLAIFLVALLARYPFQIKVNSLEAASAGIEIENTDGIPMKVKMASARQEIEELKKKQEVYDLATEQLTDMQWPQILQIIADTVPDNVRIVSISTAGLGHFMLTGEAWIESEIRSFAKELQKSGIIETAKVGAIKYDDSDTHIMVKYEITCDVNLKGEKL